MQNRIGIYQKRCLLGLVGISLLSSTVLAGNWADEITLTGFMSAKFQKTNEANASNYFDETVGKDGSWAGTSLGVNLFAPVSDRITLATQFYATQEENNYATHLDWAFASYAVNDELQVRAGKIKFSTGLVSEYVDVGNSYPWINAPKLFYTENAKGPNITREAYTGVSGIFEKEYNELIVHVEMYGGMMELESMTVKKLIGAKFKLNWDDVVNLQMTYYRGLMTDTAMAVMERKIHSNFAIGLNVDWNDVIVYAEAAKTDMELDILESKSAYVTLGYQIDNWLPHVTYQVFEKGLDTLAEQKQTISTLGLRYDIADNVDIKFEYSLLNTKQGSGLFEDKPTNENTDMYGVSLDLVF